jgi:hypothetical protein
VKQRLRIALVAIAVGFAISFPLRIESYVLSVGLTLVLYAPAIVVALIAIRHRNTTLGAASLLALGCALCLRLVASQLMFWLAFQNRIDLWAPVVICLPAAAFFFVRPIAGVRPATVIAGAAQAWWFCHTFTDFLYYNGNAVQTTLAIASALFLIAVVKPAAFRWQFVWSTIEPACVILIGWLSSVPFYKIHTQNMRISDLEMQMFSVALPCAIVGLIWSGTTRHRASARPPARSGC